MIRNAERPFHISLKPRTELSDRLSLLLSLSLIPSISFSPLSTLTTTISHFLCSSPPPPDRESNWWLLDNLDDMSVIQVTKRSRSTESPQPGLESYVLVSDISEHLLNSSFSMDRFSLFLQAHVTRLKVALSTMRMTIIVKVENFKCWCEFVEKLEPLHKRVQLLGKPFGGSLKSYKCYHMTQ